MNKTVVTSLRAYATMVSFFFFFYDSLFGYLKREKRKEKINEKWGSYHQLA